MRPLFPSNKLYNFIGRSTSCRDSFFLYFLKLFFIFLCFYELTGNTKSVYACGSYTQISAGGEHSLALSEDGTVWSWGSNKYGKLGDGTIDDRTIPGLVLRADGTVFGEAVKVFAGVSYTSFALTNDGLLWGWGRNTSHQLSDGTTLDRYTPIQVLNCQGEPLQNVVSVASSTGYVTALKQDGFVWAWGGGLECPTAVIDNYGQPLNNVSQLASADSHFLALKNDGSVWAWGSNINGQLGDGSRYSRSNPVPVRLDGALFENVISISAGGYHSVALQNNGTVWNWGIVTEADGQGEVYRNPVQVKNADGQPFNNVIAIASGWAHRIALTSDNSVWGWGVGKYGALADGSGIYSYPYPKQILDEYGQPLDSITSISSNGQYFTLALNTAGKIFGWGWNSPGTLGDGSTADRYYAIRVAEDCSSTSDVTVTVTAPTGDTTYNHGNEVTINWETENTDPADTMVLSMKRDAASDMAAPDDRSWYRFTENTPNDGTETVTIPDSALTASDWRFYVRHVSSGEYAASGIVELAEAENIGQLYIEKSGDGLGTVSRAIPGRRPQTLCDIDSTSQVHRFPVGATVGIIAEADTNSVFSGWEGCDLVVDEQCYITVNDYEEVSAQFNAAEDATVELSVSFFDQPYEQGSVVSDPPGISCSDSKGTCRAKFVPGQTVTLTPTAAHGAIFEEWQNTWDSTPCSSQSGDACIITVPTSGRSVNLRPNFGPDTQQNLNLVIEGNGSGNVTSTSGGINCSSDGANAACNEIFEEGTEVTLKAVAEPGSVFLHWGGWDEWAVNPCFASEDPECTFTMYWPHTVKAIFSAENLAVVDIQPNVQLLDNSVVIYPIDVINSGTEDSGEATVDIQASAVGNGGEEISRRCDDQYNEDRGTCTKVNDDQFKITVKQGEGVRIIVSRYYGSDVNTATLGATVSYSKDADPDDNEKSVNLHRDPATLPGLRTDIRLQYYGGTSADSSERNTLVFTHGWQDTDPPECEGLEKQAMLKCFSKHLWSGKNSEKGLASALAMKNFYYIGDAPNPINEELNFTQYIWAGAFTQSGMSAEGYIQARRHVFDAGRRLGKQLIEDLGSDYSRKIHFVGHSLGTAVNAYAVRYFLDNLTEEARNNVTIQMTILDYPNRISKIGVLPAVIGLWPDLSREEQKQWGFDEYFFADVLPELDDPNKKDRLYVDNYFAAKTTPLDTKISSAGVGTAISGKNVYNHLKDSGLYDPNDVGQHLFWGENFLENFNDHSGVHQWYRWTMWPDQNEYLRGNQFVCSNGVWTKPLLLKLLDNSLNPCNTGFAHSILLEGWQPEDFPQRNGYVTDFSPAAQYDMVGGGTTQRCSMTENPLQITCSNLSAPMQPELALAADQSEPAAAAIDTASDYVHTNINLSKEIGSLSFKYRLTNTDTKEPVHLLIDGVVVWSMSAQSDTQEEWTVSGKIPVALTKGEHTLMLAFNRTSEDAEFAMQELQFFEAPSKNGFLPAMLFLLLNK